MYKEFEIIERIKELFPNQEGLSLGIGDDCAILDPGRFDLVTTDTIVEGIHFTMEWCSPEDIGWKAIACSLSDIAAMGGGPGAFFLNLSLPKDSTKELVDGLLLGMKNCCDTLVPSGFECSIGGGDISASPGPLLISVTLLGEASPAGPVTRSNALPGDRIAILGPTGVSRTALELLTKHPEKVKDFPELISTYQKPMPRIREGALLGLYGVPSAMIDISDGLLQDLGHILKSSGVGAKIECHNLPTDPNVLAACAAISNGADPFLDHALNGGEDFELLIIVPPARMTKLWDLARRYDWDVYDIGEIRSPEEGLVVLGLDGENLDLEANGYEHFS